MSYELKFTNYRVTVEPESYPSMLSPDERDKNACDAIVQQIKRHVDGWGYVRVDRDAYRVCSHCGYEAGTEEWEKYGKTIECCQEAIDEAAK